jgi:hypothetical protein
VTTQAKPQTVLGWGSVYLDAARTLAAEAGGAGNSPDHEGQRASSAIFAAGAAIECTVHELTFLFADSGDISIAQACSVGGVGNPPARYKELAQIISVNRQSKPPNFGVAEYEKACCVWKCRNHLIHYEPERRNLGLWPPELGSYVIKGWLPNLLNDEHWTSRLPTSPVAQDLSRFAREFIEWFDSVLRFPDAFRKAFGF